MRFREFKNPVVLEYDTSLTDKQLRDEIVGMLKTEDDREMLDKIYTALNESGLVDRIIKILGKDEDAKSKLKIFSGIILNTPGTFAEKDGFLKNFPKGFIDTKALTNSNAYKSYADWFTGDAFATRVFEQLYTFTPQGIGPGEYALAIMSPNIQFAGRSSTIHGDLVIDGVATEVKAKNVAGGRFFDGRKARMDQAAVRAAFLEYEIIYDKGMSAGMWAKDIRPQLEKADIKYLVDHIIKGAFAFVKGTEVASLKKALSTGDVSQIKQEWGMLSFTNYKRMSGFSAMLLLDSPKQSSLYFTKIEDVSSLVKADMPYVMGPEQQIHPQMSFTGRAGGESLNTGVGPSEPKLKVQKKTKAAPKKAAPRGKVKASSGGREDPPKANMGRAKRK